MRKLSVLIVFAIATHVWIARSVIAQPAAPAAPAAAAKAGDVKVEDVLRQMADYLGKLPAYSCKAESVLDVASKIQSSNRSTKFTVRVERPNRLAVVVDEGVDGLAVVSDGKKLTQYLPMLKRYVVKEAPANFDGMTEIGGQLPPQMPDIAGDLVANTGEQLYKRLMDGVTKSEYLGEEKVGDVACHHVRFIQENFNWEAWIETGKQPVIRKIKPDLAKQLTSAGYEIGDAKIELATTFSDWNVAPKFTEADFTFKAPEDAEEGDSFAPEEPPHPLLGQPAPAFATTDVEGKPIDLKAHLGKNVVMLDFWATWCGPCVAAMPQVDEVAKKFKDKGVVFYAVNCGEDVETIKKFLAEAKLDPTVALDEKNEIGPLYKVSGIPQTVLIGKDGKVQVVHVGFGGDLGKMLAKEVEDLLAGKDLAKEVLEKAEKSHKKRAAKQGADAPAGEAAPTTPNADK